MMSSDQVRDFYTRNASLYHHLYIDILRYGRGMNAFLQRSGVLAPNLRILSSAMLEYIPKDRLAEALAGLRRRLADDGTLTVFITRRNTLMKGLIEWWWKANIYTRDELREIYREAGFDEITFHRFPRPFFHLNLWGLIVEARNLQS